MFTFWGLRKKSLDVSGAILGTETFLVRIRKCVEYITILNIKNEYI